MTAAFLRIKLYLLPNAALNGDRDKPKFGVHFLVDAPISCDRQRMPTKCHAIRIKRMISLSRGFALDPNAKFEARMK